MRENIELTTVEMDLISLQSTVDWDLDITWNFYTKDEADHRVFISLRDDSVPQNTQTELKEMISQELQTVDESVTPENISTVECGFSDQESNVLECLRGYMKTEHPYQYFNVENLQEYIKKTANSEEEKQKLKAMDSYEVYYLEHMFPNSQEDENGNVVPPNRIKEFAESEMKDYIDLTFHTDWEHRTESNSFAFGDFDNELVRGTSYFVWIPVTNGEIGVTK